MKDIKFKVGDKVKIIANDDGSGNFIGSVGVIIETDRIKKRYSFTWDYQCSFDNDETYVFGLHEMKKMPNKGEQLLLFEL